MKRFSILLFLPVLLFSGCAISMKDLTPSEIPANPSGIYTITLNSKIIGENIDDDSVTTEIVIDGETHPMTPSPTDDQMFFFEYEMPEGRAGARYYYIVSYKIHGVRMEEPKSKVSPLHEFQLTNRYVVELESYRGPAGTVIPVLGRGFTVGDVIVLGQTEAETEYVSPNQLSFVVPPLQPGMSYPVVWRSDAGDRPVGNFRIDRAVNNVSVTPSSLVLNEGDTRVLGFQIDREAPPGGLPIDVTTDVPDSVIMPEVEIPAGYRTVSVQVEGGQPGQGQLFISVPGAEGETAVPISVNPAE